MQDNQFKENLEAEMDNQSVTGNDVESNENFQENSKNEEIASLQLQVDELKDKYLRLVADFDNYRKRTAKERLELIQTAGKDVIGSLLEVLDDCERAEKQVQGAKDLAAVQEGLALVFNKLKSILQQKGLRPMDAVGVDFNPDHHEAITEIPAPNEEMKGKVIDEVEKGYYINDKIIRFAKVVVGK